MMKTLGLLVLAGVCSTGTVLAERSGKVSGKAQDAPLLSDVDRYKTAISDSRRKLFDEGMSGLTPAHREIFWATYNDYEAEKNEIAAARVEVVKKFSDTFAGGHELSDEEIAETVHQLTALQTEVSDLRLKYFDLLSERIDVKTAGRFALIDDYVTTSIRFEWLNQIPFPGDEGE
jgi:hypothetical protein